MGIWWRGCKMCLTERFTTWRSSPGRAAYRHPIADRIEHGVNDEQQLGSTDMGGVGDLSIAL